MRSRLSVLLLLLCLAIARKGNGQMPDVERLPWSQWSFHVGNDPRCAAADDPGCVWQGPSSPNRPFQGEIWQRVEITLPQPLRTEQQLGLLVQGEWPVYEVYLNGRLIGRSGSFEKRRGPQNSRAIFSFSPDIAPAGRLVVAIHAQNLRTALDPMDFTPAIAPMDRIGAVMAEDTLVNLHECWQIYFCYLIMLSVGLVFLVLFALDRQARENLWLGLNLCSLGCLCLGNFATAIDVGMSSMTAMAIYFTLNAWMAAIIVEFSFSLMRRRVWFVFRLVEICGFLFAIQLVLLLPVPGSVYEAVARLTPFLYLCFRTVVMLTAIARLVPLPLCFRSPLPEMRWIGACLLFITVTAESRHVTSIWARSSALGPYFGASTFNFLSYSYALFAIVMLAAMTVRFRRIQHRSQIMERELAAASAMQQLLLSRPSSSTPVFDLETVYLPDGEVGGDFFHIIPADNDASNGALLIVVGDVSGKGLQAAMTVSTIIGALRGCTLRSPAAVLAYLNRVLVGHVTGFVTCCVTHADGDGTVRIANAGNPAPYCNGEEVHTLPGLPLGMIEDATYDETSYQIAPQDTLTFVSDGVIEATGPAGELFGFARTRAMSTRSASAIAEAARNFGQHDDITVLTITRTAVPVQQIA
ncbi:MAG: PP2C family protein-serine/threonine phosphatase [Terracidiphilus sp.]